MNLKKIKKMVKKVCRNIFNKKYYALLNYKKYLTLPIDKNAVLLESTHGEIINGNIFYLLKELCENKKYKKFNKYLVIEKNIYEHVKKKLDYYKLTNVNIVFFKTKEYYKMVATSKFLVNDSTFLHFFIKRDEQVYLNTWHGTPLKNMGKSVEKECHIIGNIQKNLYSCDYLLYPNDYTKDIFLKDYMLYNAKNDCKIIMNGYPRNTIFFNKKRNEEIRKENDLADEQVICYMPTWRGKMSDKIHDKNVADTIYYLKKMEAKLAKNQRLYVNLHPYFKGKIDFSIFKKVMEFPEEYETYDFLNIADVLITDYSSVFFDFANTGKQIINFIYDEDDYLEERGMYLDINDLPFDKTKSVNKLFELIENGKKYDDKEFLKKFCSYDNLNASQQILDKFLFNKDSKNQKILDMPNNGKENVLIYGGSLTKNGITTALKGLLNNLDSKKYNYFLTFYSKKVAKYKETLLMLPDYIQYIPIQGVMNLTFKEKLIMVKSSWFNKKNKKGLIKLIEKNGQLELKRIYGNLKIDKFVHFVGYDNKSILLFSTFSGKKSIFVHNDMISEINKKRSCNYDILHYAYNHYDEVIPIAVNLIEPTVKIKGDNNNIKVVNNQIDYQKYLDMAEMPLVMDKTTSINIPYNDFVKILNNKKAIKFINIGRFSPEKGQKRLIDAFEKFYKNNKNVYLIIMGGYGVLYDEILEYVSTLEARNNIIILKSVSNPYNILKRCNLFIMSSFYEGLPMTIMEALILNVPVVSTDIKSSRDFLSNGCGCLVPDSEEGVLLGMKKYINKELKDLKPFTIEDAKEFNDNALKEFYSLLK